MLLGNVLQVYHSFCSPLTVGVPPHEARERYVKLADYLLRNIPGDHQTQMSKWHAWDLSQSPPLPGYPNPAYDMAHPTVQDSITGPTLKEGKKKATEGNNQGPTVPAITGGEGGSLLNNPNFNKGITKEMENNDMDRISPVVMGGADSSVTVREGKNFPISANPDGLGNMASVSTSTSPQNIPGEIAKHMAVMGG